MIERSHFNYIRERHDSYASGAIWAPAGNTPKSNICDLSVLDPQVNFTLLNTIQNDVVMVGLNISRLFSEPFRNFHDSSPHTQDFWGRTVFLIYARDILSLSSYIIRDGLSFFPH